MTHPYRTDRNSRLSPTLRVLTPADWHAQLAIAISAVGLLHGSGLIPGALTIFLLSIHLLLGRETAMALLQRRLSLLEVTSFGPALGMLWMIGLQQFVLLISGSSRVFWVLSVVVAFLLRHNNRGLRVLQEHSDIDARLLVPVAGLSLTLLAPGFSWTTVAGLTLLSCSLLAKVSQLKPNHEWLLKSLYGLTLFGGSTLAVTRFVADTSWKLAAFQDAAFFDALGIFVARFGADGASPTLVGQSVHHYHWLLYGSQGIISDFSGTAPFVVQIQISGFVNSVMIISSATVIFRLLGGSQLISLTMSAAAVNISGFHSLNLSEGFIVLAVQYALSFDFDRRRASSEMQFTTGVTLLTVAALLAKGTSFLAALSVAGSAQLIRARHSWKVGLNRGILRFSLLPTLMSIGTIVGIFFTKYGLALSQFDGKEPVSLTKFFSSTGVNEGAWALRGQMVGALCMAVATASTIGLLVGALRDSYQRASANSERHQFIALTSIVVTVLCLAAVGRSVFSPSVGFVIGSGLQTAVFLILCACTITFPLTRYPSMTLHAGRSTSILAFSILLVCTIFALFFRSSLWRDQAVPRLWGNRIAASSIGRWLAYGLVDQQFVVVSATMFIGVLVWTCFGQKRTNEHAGFRRRGSIVLAAPIFAAVLGYATMTTATAVLKTSEGRHQSLTSEHPHIDRDINWPTRRSPDLIALGKFVRSSTQNDDVFASNNFCCFGESWLQLSELADPEIYQDDFGGANFQLPAETQRRFLVQGLLFSGAPYRGNGSLTTRETSFLRLSLSFANSPTKRDVSELQDLGVRYFVVNLRLTALSDWGDFATERFRSSEFLLLELGSGVDT